MNFDSVHNILCLALNISIAEFRVIKIKHDGMFFAYIIVIRPND